MTTDGVVTTPCPHFEHVRLIESLPSRGGSTAGSTSGLHSGHHTAQRPSPSTAPAHPSQSVWWTRPQSSQEITIPWSHRLWHKSQSSTRQCATCHATAYLSASLLWCDFAIPGCGTSWEYAMPTEQERCRTTARKLSGVLSTVLCSRCPRLGMSQKNLAMRTQMLRPFSREGGDVATTRSFSRRVNYGSWRAATAACAGRSELGGANQSPPAFGDARRQRVSLRNLICDSLTRVVVSFHHSKRLTAWWRMRYLPFPAPA